MLSLSKAIVVVDEDVDVHDYAEVFFTVGANVDPKRDVVLAEGPLDHLDHAPTLQFFGGKLGIDATAKTPAEGAREWPEPIAMSDSPSRRTIRTTWRRCAPRATRIPISRVRRVTAYAMTP